MWALKAKKLTAAAAMDRSMARVAVAPMKTPSQMKAAIPVTGIAGRFSCKHESACLVPRVNWDNKKRLLSSQQTSLSL